MSANANTLIRTLTCMRVTLACCIRFVVSACVSTLSASAAPHCVRSFVQQRCSSFAGPMDHIVLQVAERLQQRIPAAAQTHIKGNGEYLAQIRDVAEARARLAADTHAPLKVCLCAQTSCPYKVVGLRWKGHKPFSPALAPLAGKVQPRTCTK